MRRWLPVLAVIVCLTATACGGSDGAGAGGGSAHVLKPGEQIGMKSLRFRPDHVQVAVGQQVRWRNDEGIGHDVKAESGADFASETFGKDGNFAWTPAKAGTVKYVCTLHPGMDGTIDVVAK